MIPEIFIKAVSFPAYAAKTAKTVCVRNTGEHHCGGSIRNGHDETVRVGFNTSRKKAVRDCTCMEVKMGFLKNIIRNAVSDGISKGIREAVSSATEKIIAPKAEEYANKVADSLDNAAGEVNAAASAVNTDEVKNGVSSLEESLNRLSKSAEKAAAALEKAAASQEDLNAMWKERVPDFPVWCFGGTNFWFDENGTAADGGVYYIFNADNAPMEGLDLYVALLKENGFVRKYKDSDEVLYKDLGGEYLVFGTTEAFGSAPVMSVSMVRTKDRSEIEC